MNNPNIISIGNRDLYPRETWGTRDRAQAQREERVRAEVRAQSARITPVTAFEPLPVAPLHPVQDIGPLYVKPTPRWKNARSKSIDLLLAKHGIRAK